MTRMRSKACSDKSIWVQFIWFDGSVMGHQGSLNSGMSFQSCLPAPHPLSYVVEKAEMKYGSLEGHAFVKGYYSCNKTFVICTISHYISRLLGSLPSLKENTLHPFSFSFLFFLSPSLPLPLSLLLSFFSFFIFIYFKIYFIDYTITVVLIFPLLPPLHLIPHFPPEISPLLHVHGSCM